MFNLGKVKYLRDGATKLQILLIDLSGENLSIDWDQTLSVS